jgi:hypothetical protein
MTVRRHRPRCSRLTAALALVSLLTASPAFAAPGDALERGRICWFALDLPCAERELSAAHAERQALPLPQQIELLKLIAELRLSAEEPDRARSHLVELLDLEPTFAPKWPAPWIATLDEARRLARDLLPPVVTATLPSSAKAGASLTVTAHVTDPSGVARVELAVASSRFTMSTTDGELWSARVPRELVARGLEIQVLAWDRHGNGPVTFPAAPHAVAISAEPAPPITSRWWFWASIAGAAGLAVALGFALAPSDTAPSSSGNLGIKLELP